MTFGAPLEVRAVRLSHLNTKSSYDDSKMDLYFSWNTIDRKVVVN